MVTNLNYIIDVNYYPIKSAKFSNKQHRPIGCGVQGMADLFSILRLPYDSSEADELNFHVFEHLYYAALDKSCDLAAKYGTYQSYPGSPVSRGELQFDMWIKEQALLGRNPIKYTSGCAWTALRERIAVNGLYNSLVVAQMPTGSTASIMGNSPCIEAHSALFYKRRAKVEFSVVNRYLIRDLTELGIWNEDVRDMIQLNERGSIANCEMIPVMIRNIYKTIWEIPLSKYIDMAMTREVFIDQSESFSWFVDRPDKYKLSGAHFYGWRRGRKTSSYYTRQLAAVDAKKIQVSGDLAKARKAKNQAPRNLTDSDDCGDKGFCGA